MGDTDVAIGESELNLIGEYVQSHLPGWMEQLGVRAPADPVTNTQLLERVLRAEEELKAGREVMVARFEASDRRFESIDLRIGDLIKTVDDRFNSLTKTMDDRFHTVDERFRSAAKATDDRFTDLIKTMDDRFKAMDKRFEDLTRGFNKRFGLLTWMIGVSIAMIAATLGVLLV